MAGTIKTPMNQWLVDKISAYITEHEGCRVPETTDTKDGIQLNVVDVFGFVYTVEVKMVARINAAPSELFLIRESS